MNFLILGPRLRTIYILPPLPPSLLLFPLPSLSPSPPPSLSLCQIVYVVSLRDGGRPELLYAVLNLLRHSHSQPILPDPIWQQLLPCASPSPVLVHTCHWNLMLLRHGHPLGSRQSWFFGSSWLPFPQLHHFTQTLILRRDGGEFLSEDWSSLPFSTSLFGFRQMHTSLALLVWISKHWGEMFILSHLTTGRHHLNVLVFLDFNHSYG